VEREGLLPSFQQQSRQEEAAFYKIRGEVIMARPFYNPNQFSSVLPNDIGRVMFVDSVYGSAGYSGLTPNVPKAALDNCVNHCAGGEAAVIYCMPNHAENIDAAGAIALDTAGIKVIGLGWGESRPTFTWTAAAGTITITAANIWLENLLLKVGVDAVVVGISVAGADCTLKDLEVRDDDSNYNSLDFITSTDAADRLQILDHVHQGSGGAAGAQTAISLVGGSDTIVIPRHIDGNFATACIENVTTLCDTLRVFGRASRPAYLRNRNSGDILVTVKSDTTGHIGPHLYGRLADNAANITEAFAGGDMAFYPPLELVNLDGESSVASNITASTDT